MKIKTKSRTQEVAEFMQKTDKHLSVLDLINQLGMTVKDANNVFYSIRKSGRYDTDEKTVNECKVMKVLSIKTSKYNFGKHWVYTKQETRERLIWDMAIFGIEPVRNKAFELELL